jgi:hypothetical protein
MTVEVLRLSGLPAEEAEQAANTLLDTETGPYDLTRLLVLDDTALLVQHSPVYRGLVSAGRVEKMLCVAVGPRAGDGRSLHLRGNLGGNQGAGVLWVSDPRGIDWRVGMAAVAKGRPPGKVSGPDLLLQLLSVDELFDRVRDRLETQVPGRVASPGLRVAGADDESATFALALAMGIRVLTDPGGLGRPGGAADGPFPALLPAAAGGARLEGGAPLARYCDEVTDYAEAAAQALGRKALGGMLRGRDGDFRDNVIGARDALAYLRDLVGQLLTDASARGELARSQRQLVQAAGLRFPAAAEAPTADPGQSGGERVAAEQSAVYRAVADAVGGGDPLGRVSGRLAQTEPAVRHLGSAAYLPELERACPASLLARLSAAPQRPPRQASAAARRDLGLDDAEQAARALVGLVIEVANREWSPAMPSPAELSRVRIALDGARRELTEHAAAAGDLAQARSARLKRLSESLLPMLRDLVLGVAAIESAAPSASGRDAFDAARARTAARLAEWTRHVQAHGVSAAPPFASAAVHEVPLAIEEDAAGVREALVAPVADEMWQLCAPGDLKALNPAVPPVAIRFASRLARDTLAGALSGEDPVWTSSGSFAGLLRLVPLRAGVVVYGWGEHDLPAPPDSTTPDSAPADPTAVAEPPR